MSKNVYPKSHVAGPLNMQWETVETETIGGKLLLRRLALEAMGWRIHYEDDLPRRDRTHYVYWVGPHDEMNGLWWTEGLYRANPVYHWYPPALTPKQMLNDFIWSINTVSIGDTSGFTVQIHTDEVNSAATADVLDVAVCSAILGTLKFKAEA